MKSQKKTYAVDWCKWDSSEILGIFSSRERAQTFIDKYKDRDRARNMIIEKFILNKPGVIV